MIIRSEEIYKKANSIVKSCGTRDTLKIARELGIHLHFLDNLNDLLGMYTYRHKERHMSHGSVREIFDWDELCKVELPVPSIEKQRSIVKAYNTITDRIELKRKINDNLAA